MAAWTNAAPSGSNRQVKSVSSPGPGRTLSPRARRWASSKASLSRCGRAHSTRWRTTARRSFSLPPTATGRTMSWSARYWPASTKGRTWSIARSTAAARRTDTVPAATAAATGACRASRDATATWTSWWASTGSRLDVWWRT